MISDVAIVIVQGHHKPCTYKVKHLIDNGVCVRVLNAPPVGFSPSLSLPSGLPSPGDKTILKLG